ncbi:hypothetical protein [Paludisphaera sp.]|uniref:hypothetical protein n=1 Tax=Paludisphaera sp. TaxID=2017432 RepID=UPI00301E1624
MSGERRDQAEQEVSIRRRGHELFVEEQAPKGPSRPFAEVLRETPAAPLSGLVKAALWAIAIVAALLFAAALWRLINRPNPKPPRRARPRASAKAPRAAATSVAPPAIALRPSTPTDQEPRG